MYQNRFAKSYALDLLLNNTPWLGRPVDQIKILLENNYTTQEIVNLSKSNVVNHLHQLVR